jgi:hypothetical protein
MARLVYTNRKTISFNDLHEVYETIGMLTAGRYSRIKIEQNQESGAWGEEGRIQIYSDLDKFLDPIEARFSAGVGNILVRVNSNAFVEDLIINHGFTVGEVPSGGTVAEVISPTYEGGLALVENGYEDDYIRGYFK